jgi:hypothetical protein
MRVQSLILLFVSLFVAVNAAPIDLGASPLQKRDAALYKRDIALPQRRQNGEGGGPADW